MRGITYQVGFSNFRVKKNNFLICVYNMKNNAIQSNSLLERGMKSSLFPVPLATACKIYKYLICMAALELRISAAWCINLALSTSAAADMIFAFDSLSVLEVIDKSA